MAKKFTKLIPEGQGGSSPSDSRDYYVICYNATASGRGTLSAYYVLYSENPTKEGSGAFHLMGANGNRWITLNKGDKIAFQAYGNGFEYIRSESLGINVTTALEFTEWIELTEDLFDLEMYSWVSDSSGGSND